MSKRIQVRDFDTAIAHLESYLFHIQMKRPRTRHLENLYNRVWNMLFYMKNVTERDSRTLDKANELMDICYGALQ